MTAKQRHTLLALWIMLTTLFMSFGCKSGDSSQDTMENMDDAAILNDAEGSTDATNAPLGTVDLIATFEPDSAWTTSPEARQMVADVFAQFEGLLQTSGDWNARVEVYLTDDNPGFANTSFDETFSQATVDGQSVLVVPAWQSIVNNQPIDGPAFSIHFNVADQFENAGLLRHEMMHGLGAVNMLSNFTVASAGPLMGPMPNDTTTASLYDLRLVDLDGVALLSQYDEGTKMFTVQDYRIETTLTEWMDGAGGVSFRGIGDDGSDFDMRCGTFPVAEDTGAIMLNEPRDLMSAGVHPSWNNVAEPDRAFLRAMGYTINDALP
jgi:hypothetical protein